MTKESGLGMTVGVDVSAGGALKQLENDMTNISWTQDRALQDTTGLDKSGHERLHLLGDFQVTFNGVFNDATDKSHDVFKVLAGERTVTIIHSAQTLSTECLLGAYNLTRAADGSLTYSVPAMLSNGTLPIWS